MLFMDLLSTASGQGQQCARGVWAPKSGHPSAVAAEQDLRGCFLILFYTLTQYNLYIILYNSEYCKPGS